MDGSTHGEGERGCKGVKAKGVAWGGVLKEPPRVCRGGAKYNGGGGEGSSLRGGRAAPGGRREGGWDPRGSGGGHRLRWQGGEGVERGDREGGAAGGKEVGGVGGDRDRHPHLPPPPRGSIEHGGLGAWRGLRKAGGDPEGGGGGDGRKRPRRRRPRPKWGPGGGGGGAGGWKRWVEWAGGRGGLFPFGCRRESPGKRRSWRRAGGVACRVRGGVLR